MNQFEMVAFIVFAVMVASVIRAALKHRGDRRSGLSASDEAETLRLREELKLLKERMAVIERITVEKENSLEREIESLRDRAPAPLRGERGEPR